MRKAVATIPRQRRNSTGEMAGPLSRMVSKIGKTPTAGRLWMELFGIKQQQWQWRSAAL